MGGKIQAKSWIFSRWFLIGGILVLILLALGYSRAWYGQYRVRQEIAELEAERQALEAKKLETLGALQYAASLDFVEEKARRDLNMVKPGESMAVISTSPSIPQNKAGQEGTAVVQSRPTESNFVKWWRYFFGTN